MLKSIHNQLNFGEAKKKFSLLQKLLILLIIASSIIVILKLKKIYLKRIKFFLNMLNIFLV
jgi:hypothetical protein